ncbi:nucleoside recognition domain-containing protein [Aquibacillus sp. 3ASR75-11]|uniref:Nucleoside recognition domain-containing protein n=1 Tax=Terrihalobacillus insolitus TaxID=2950438 RepID=A0A9X3WTB6_9BACI|nr:nucleoside recognition domain-containing protein [Terrihalobacillus insolitus]MDC3412263.1 nucleoside recognition domain-containing protein [Terrihalobacillus insolitus]MDC3423044.1 nucleoside recognition domain-containing protein [Terrihalobacillus insolitus]
MIGVIKRGIWKGLTLTWTLGKVIFPVTLFVTILRYTPALPWLMERLTPILKFIGLSGEAAVPLVLGNFLNLYAGIAAIVSFDFTVKEVFIMAVMLSFSHNLFIESAVASKVGVKWWVVVGIRISLAFLSAALINGVWNGGDQLSQYGFISKAEQIPDGWFAISLQGLETAFMGVLQLALIVIPLMVGIQFMREKGWMDFLSEKLAPFMKVLGMRENTSMTLVAGLTIGLAYGAGLMIQAVQEDGVTKKDMYLALIFLVSCHAVVEDTLIFIPLGIPVWPLLLFRVTTAIVLTAVVGFAWNRVEINKGRKELAHEHSYHSV